MIFNFDKKQDNKTLWDNIMSYVDYSMKFFNKENDQEFREEFIKKIKEKFE